MFTMMMFHASMSALAADSEFDGAAAPTDPFEEPETDLSAEVGGALASGNTEFWTVNGLVTGAHRFDRNKFALELGANLGGAVVDGDADGFLSDAERAGGRVQNAEKYWTEGRYDRFVGKRDSVYALAGALVDPFAGYDLRSHEQLGYSRILTESDATKLLAEVGIDLAQENYVDGVDPGYQDILAARLMFGLTHQFTDDVAFSDTVEAYENLIDIDDLRVLNEAALTTKLSDTFSIKLSHQLTWDNVPVEGFRKFDQTALVTLVASIL